MPLLAKSRVIEGQCSSPYCAFDVCCLRLMLGLVMVIGTEPEKSSFVVGNDRQGCTSALGCTYLGLIVAAYILFQSVHFQVPVPFHSLPSFNAFLLKNLGMQICFKNHPTCIARSVFIA